MGSLNKVNTGKPEPIKNLINKTLQTIKEKNDMVTFTRPNSGSNSLGGFSEQINPGEYQAKFTGFEECKIPVFEKQGEFYDGISLNFEIAFDKGDPILVTRKVRTVISAGRGAGTPSNFYKDLCGMNGGEPAKEILLDDNAVENLLTSYIGKPFTILVGNKVDSKGNSYSKFLSVAKPLPKGRAVASQININNDDIPF